MRLCIFKRYFARGYMAHRVFYKRETGRRFFDKDCAHDDDDILIMTATKTKNKQTDNLSKF